MHWYIELATLKQFHLKASSKQWVARRCYAAAERCALMCLPPSQMHLQARRSARFVARKTFQPGSSYHLHMKHDVTAPQEQQKPAAMMHLLQDVAGNS